MANHHLTLVQSGIHGLLDVARQTYKEATEDVYQHVDEICSKIPIRSKENFPDKDIRGAWACGRGQVR